jgi:hypothetical protein
MKTLEHKMQRNLRELKRLGLEFSYPRDIAYDWATQGRSSWVLPYIRNARGRVSFRNHWQVPTVVERKAAFPSGLRLSGTLSDWLQRIAAGTNAKAARVAEALISAASSRVSHAVTPFGNYFAVREREGLISYCPANRTQGFTHDGKWERNGRVEIKPAKFARGILRHPERFRDDEYAAFAEAFGGVEAGEKIDWQVLTSAEEITRAYDAREWGAERSDEYPHGIQSCMWGEDVGPFFARIGVRLLVGVQHDTYVARALLWETSQLGTVVDRLYGQPHVKEALMAHIFAQGWAKKEHDRAGNSSWLKPNGGVFSGELTSDAAQEPRSTMFFPYIDSFRYQCGTTFSTWDADAEFSYENQDGTRTDAHRGQVQDVNGDWISEDEAVCVNGTWYHSDSDEIVYCERSSEHILREDAYEVDLGGRRGVVYVHEDYISRA